MKVAVGGVLSSEREICSGVPQGTVLGPVLFLVFINYVAEDVQCRWKAFADDYKLYMSFPDIPDEHSISAMQRDLDVISRVGRSWNLHLNTAKCVAMRFGYRGPRNSLAPCYSINEQRIPFVDQMKDLGVVVDDKLRFHHHLRTIVGRAGGLMSDLLRSTVCRSPDFMLTLFITHIRPIIEYCSSVWNVGDLRKIVVATKMDEGN